jgi:hypothetical protein
VAAAPPDAVRRRLIAGDREPPLPREHKRALIKARRRTPCFLYKLCIDEKGVPIEVTVPSSPPPAGVAPACDYVTPAEAPAVHAYLREQIGAWRFAPSDPPPEEPLCTAILLRYRLDG